MASALAGSNSDAAISAAAGAVGRTGGLSPPSGHQVPARHPHVLMGEDVTVVQPAAGVVLDEAGGHGLVGTEARIVHGGARGVAPTVPVDVERVEHAVHAEHVDLDVLPGAGAQDRR